MAAAKGRRAAEHSSQPGRLRLLLLGVRLRLRLLLVEVGVMHLVAGHLTRVAHRSPTRCCCCCGWVVLGVVVVVLQPALHGSRAVITPAVDWVLC